MTNPAKMYLPQVALFGCGCVNSISEEIQNLNVKKALIVSDEILVKVGVVKKVTDILSKAKIDFTIFDKVKQNPTLTNVYAGLDVLKAEKCDFVISIGGGSPQDTAKAISILATNPGDLIDYNGIHKTKNKGLPIVAINTTAGTASEVTINYVITDEDKKIKMVIVDKNCLASIAVNDPELMISMPKGLTAATGMDALTHAIEGYITRGANILTDALSLEAISLISSSLEDAVNDGTNLIARTKMAYGQYMTGMAFSNCGLGIVHSMAHQLGAEYDIPHGVANAILLPYVMEYNYDICREKYAKIAVAMGKNITGLSQDDAAKLAIKAVFELAKAVKIPKLSDIKFDEKDLDKLSNQAFNDICTGGNPKDTNPQDIKKIYQIAYKA